MEDPIPRSDMEALVREKYNGNRDAVSSEDIERLQKEEPLAYVIGSQPFLGLSIGLSSHPLIPRPETEWWTELLIKRIGKEPLQVLDLCAGSGAIGLAILKHCPHALVSFGEIEEAHGTLIAKNLKENTLDEARADIRTGDLFAPFAGQRFDIIASNPPYVPLERELPENVKNFEPERALFAGSDGLSIIRKICSDISLHIKQEGELWIECDIEHIEEARRLLEEHGASHTEIRIDQYGRPRLIVGYYGNERRFFGSDL